MYIVMLVCVLVITLGVIFMLSGSASSADSGMANVQGQASQAVSISIASHATESLLVKEITGNIAKSSEIPCCANANATGCIGNVANCTYSSGSALSCQVKKFDVERGRCV